ncbi:MAG: NADH-quinone oxidoreductase subunit H [Myxococcota bacterium]
MISLVLAVAWFSVIAMALCGHAAFERASRLVGVARRPDLELPRREWGFEFDRPPASYAALRALASVARLVRGRTLIAESSQRLGWISRLVCLLATASALSLVPFASTWGGSAEGRRMVAVDLEYGLAVLLFLTLLSGLAQAAAGLAERNVWARLAAVRVEGHSLVGVALLLLVLAPLVLETGSLRLHDMVLVQQGSYPPLAFVVRLFSQLDLNLDVIAAIRLPNWFLFSQPLTAILIVPTLNLLFQRDMLSDAMAGTSGLTGFGIDSDPSDLYWAGLEARLSTVLAAALFVALFLGAGGLPFFDTSGIVLRLAPLFGEALPALLLVGFEVAVFAGKLIGVLFLASLLRRSTGSARADQSMRTMTRRLIPLAWANLLLLSTLSLLRGPVGEALS